MRNLISSGGGYNFRWVIVMNNEIVVESLEEYIKTVNNLRMQGYLFRGISQKELEPIPSILYSSSDFEVDPKCEWRLENEEKNLKEVIQGVQSIYPNVDRLTAIEIARHYGFYCRLSDLSEDPLVSLYFVCKDDEEIDGAVHCFNRTLFSETCLNKQHQGMMDNDKFIEIWESILKDDSTGEFYTKNDGKEELLSYAYPFLIFPTIQQERITKQRAIFLMWTSLDVMPKEKEYPCHFFDRKIVIRAKAKACFRNKIAKLGYDESMLIAKDEKIEEAIRPFLK